MADQSRHAPEITVLIDGEAQDDWFPLQIERSASGKRLDFCTLVQHIRAVDMQPSSDDVQEVVVRTEDSDAADGRVLFWGKISKVRPKIITPDERIEYVARVEPFHFGFPLSDFPVYSPFKKDWIKFEGAPVFNPRIDGRIYGNRHPSFSKKLGDQSAKTNVFIDPESMRTSAAEALQGITGKNQTGDIVSDMAYWSLADAVYWACWYLNTEEIYIQNPTFAELSDVIDDDDDLIRDLKLKVGDYLPQIMDKLLDPFGYTWYLEHEDEETRKIVLYKRGVGTDDNTVLLQRPGETFDIADTDLAEAPGLEIDYSTAINAVQGLGDFVEIESTFFLFKGWPQADDALLKNPLQLSKTDSQSAKSVYKDHPDVGRKFVLNEAGDYFSSDQTKTSDGLLKNSRPEIIDPYFDFAKYIKIKLFDQAIDFDSSFFVPKRRKFLPCLTLDKDGKPIGKLHGVIVEILETPIPKGNEQKGDPNDPGAGPLSKSPLYNPLKDKRIWKECRDECRLLEHECGIEFTGEHLPTFMTADPAIRSQSQLIRLTATIRFDRRMAHFGSKDSSGDDSDQNDQSEDDDVVDSGSVQPDVHQLTLDLGHRFHCRQIAQQSINYLNLKENGADPGLLGLDVDDTDSLQDYVDNIRQTWDFPTVSGPLRLEGIDRTGYEIGQSITKIEGREISLTDGSGDGALAPQIAGISYDLQRQSTTLTLDHFRADKNRLQEAQGIL
jgi:hypothetical protein